MALEYSIYDLFVMMALISFLGFDLENIWLLFTKGFMDNRNMHLPFLFGYGLLVVGMYLVFGTPQNVRFLGHSIQAQFPRAAYFFMAFVAVSVGELMLGHFVHRFFGFDYWNYEWIPLHLTKYTSVPTSAGFALIITAFMYFVFPKVMEMISRGDSVFIKWLGIALVAAMVLDFAVSFTQMYKSQSLNSLWRFTMDGGLKIVHPAIA